MPPRPVELTQANSSPILAPSAATTATPPVVPEVQAPAAVTRPPLGPLWRMPPRGECIGTYGPPATTGTLGDPELVESSGIAASLLDDHILWIHNDSGDTARVFAIRDDGRPVARLELEGVRAVDFEDIAAAPCPDRSGPCLWVSDTGDNNHDRHDATIYVAREPDLRKVAPGASVKSGPIWRFPVTYPTGPVDVEALVVPQALDVLYLIEKIDAANARVFRKKAPFTENDPVEVIASLRSPGFPIRLGRMVTGAAMHPGGTRVLIRVYTGVYEYRFGPGQSMADIGSIQPVQVALGPFSESQGEAVGYDASGKGVWTVSEGRHQRPGEPLHHYSCQ